MILHLTHLSNPSPIHTHLINFLQFIMASLLLPFFSLAGRSEYSDQNKSFFFKIRKETLNSEIITRIFTFLSYHFIIIFFLFLIFSVLQGHRLLLLAKWRRPFDFTVRQFFSSASDFLEYSLIVNELFAYLFFTYFRTILIISTSVFSPRRHGL